MKATKAKAMPAPERKRGSGVKFVYDILRDEILDLALPPGSLIDENQLAERFSMSRTPIREALMRLSSEGFVAAETHRGSRVSELSPHEFADLMATRREIERLCLAKAIARGDAAWEAEIVAAMHRLSRAPLPASPLS